MLVVPMNRTGYMIQYHSRAHWYPTTLGKEALGDRYRVYSIPFRAGLVDPSSSAAAASECCGTPPEIQVNTFQYQDVARVCPKLV